MNIFKPKEAAKYVNLSVITLQRLDREGKLKAFRTNTDRRYYTKEVLDSFLGIKLTGKEPSRIIIYGRVSSNNQKADLENQVSILTEFAGINRLSNYELVKEIGGGLNFKRPNFLEIFDAISRYEVKTLLIAHKDRLCRFGFDLVEYHCKTHGCEIVILNQEKLSPETEMIQDLLAIVHCFSSRLYGLRNYRKELKDKLNAVSS